MGRRFRTLLLIFILAPLDAWITLKSPFAETPVVRSISGSIMRESDPSSPVLTIHRQERRFVSKDEIVLKTRIERMDGVVEVESETHIRALVPRFHSEHHIQSQVHETVSFDENLLRMTRKTPHGESLYTETIKKDEIVVFGPSIEPIVQKYWDRLENQKELPVLMASPRRLNTYRFDIRYLGKTDESNRCLFQLRGRSLLVRAFSKPVDFVFDCNERLLITVLGPSPLFDPDDHFANFRAITRFQAGGRTPASSDSQD